MDPKMMRRLGEIGEALDAEAVVPIDTSAWRYEGDETGYSIGDYLKADREHRLCERGHIHPAALERCDRDE